MIKTLTAVTAGVAGKIVLGAAVAAASVGGLHAAAVVDVPGLPDQADEQAVTATQNAFAEEGDGSDVEEVENLEEGPEEQSEFSLAMQEWSTCVDEASAAHDLAMVDHDASVDGPPGRFDPEEACGERPSNPAANGDQGPPEEIQAFVAAMQEWTECVQQTAPDHESCERPTPPESQAPEAAGEGSPPEGTPSGPPEGTPSGPPEGTTDGPTEESSDGPPEGTPSGPPEGTPSGPPEDAPTG